MKQNNLPRLLMQNVARSVFTAFFALFFTAFFVVFFANTTCAQTKLLTMEDAMVKNRTALAPQNLKQLQFVFGTNDYVYLKKIDGKDVWVKGGFVTKEILFRCSSRSFPWICNPPDGLPTPRW